MFTVCTDCTLYYFQCMYPSNYHPGMKGVDQIKTHIFGAWFFGRCLVFFVDLDISEYPHDSNFHCSVILRVSRQIYLDFDLDDFPRP